MSEQQHYPELLADLAEQIGARLAAEGLDVGRAADIGFSVAEYMRAHWSGAPQYFAKGVRYQCAERDRELYAKFKGHNHRALAREYSISTVRVYQIIKRVQSEIVATNQHSLF
jgi:Mor family transcriptional regulator